MPALHFFHVQTLQDLMGADEIEGMGSEDLGTLQRQKQTEEEKKRRKLEEDMQKEQAERYKKKQQLLKKEKEYEKVGWLSDTIIVIWPSTSNNILCSCNNFPDIIV